MIHRLLKKISGNILVLLVIPIVLVLIGSFLMLTESTVMDLSKNKMALYSQKYEEDLMIWSERIISQLNIYKTIIEKEGRLDEHTVEVLSASYAAYDGYPFGLYWGDEDRNFYDVSRWDPGPQYVPADRIWFSEGLEHTDSFEFGEPYIDMRTGKAAVTATYRVPFTKSVTIMAADVYFDYVTSLMEDVVKNNIDWAFVVSKKNGLIVASSDWNATGTTLSIESDSKLYSEISRLLDEGFTGMTTAEGSELYYVNICHMDKLDWYFVTCMKKSDMISRLMRIDIFIFIIGAAASIILIILVSKVSERMTDAAEKAKTDPLTRLLNREGFRVAVTTSLKKSSEYGILLLFDVDNFKRVNDELGHPVGDRFLREFADLLDGYFNRNTDICARMGGDEFAVYVERKLRKEALVGMLDKFRILFHNTFDGKYRGQNLSVSIGAAFADKGCTMEDIYKSADNALYRAKEEGKDRYSI